MRQVMEEVDSVHRQLDVEHIESLAEESALRDRNTFEVGKTVIVWVIRAPGLDRIAEMTSEAVEIS